MDIGKFKASRKRLTAWIVIPPLLAVTLGLSTYAWQQRMEMSLKDAQALSDVFPHIIEAQREAAELIESLEIQTESVVRTDDQLISFLQEAAVRFNFIVESVQVNRQEIKGKQPFPVLSVEVEGSGEFQDIQLFVNEVKSARQLISVDTLDLSLPRQIQDGERFSAMMTFNLLLVDEVLQAGGTR